MLADKGIDIGHPGDSRPPLTCQGYGHFWWRLGFQTAADEVEENERRLINEELEF
jgi:hypothetical protein